MGNTHSLCDGELSFAENGKKVRLTLKRSDEEAKALVLDGCLFNDQSLKCDGLFLYRNRHTQAALLIELKGSADIPHAVEQLAYVRQHRPAYRRLVERMNADGVGRVMEKAFIVSNGRISKPALERLERHHGIRVTAVLHSEATTPVPELRTYLPGL